MEGNTLDGHGAELEKLACRFWEKRGRPFDSAEDDSFKAERKLHRGLVGPPERLPFSSLSMGRVTS